MALQIFGSSSIGVGVRANLTTLDNVFVAQGATVGSTDDFAIFGTGSGHFAQVAGNVFGFFVGVFLGDDLLTDGGQRVVIGSGAYVGATNGSAVGVTGADSEVVNNGTVSGTYGVFLGGVGTGQSTITNSGTITGEFDAITRFSDSTETLLITNYGEIIASRFGNGRCALDSNGANAIEIVRNRGSITGDINFGLGNDIFDNRGGTIEGTVFGGDGNDIFYAGAGAETFDGGAGNDTIDFRSTAGGTIDLTGNGAGTGVALGDVYTGIETVIGSVTGVDIMIGSSAVNVLVGFGGADTLNGGGGNDFLVGNAGADTLVGGTGNDVFQYLAASEGGDKILDYGNVAGNNDTLRISAAGWWQAHSTRYSSGRALTMSRRTPTTASSSAQPTRRCGSM